MAYYLDTSAFMKLVTAESGSAAMQRWVRANPDAAFSSDLLRTEALRTARRISTAAVARVRDLLQALPIVALDAAVCEHAAVLDPLILRSLDALHLAAALTYEDELDGIVTFDRRLTDAAGLHGVPVLAPR